jgi:hypothetical protein
MGSLTIEISLKINRSFRIKVEKFAEKLLRELEKQNKQESPFDDVLGIWANRKENSKELAEALRRKNNQ